MNVSNISSANGFAITIDGRSSDIRGSLVGVVNYTGICGTDSQPG